MSKLRIWGKGLLVWLLTPRFTRNTHLTRLQSRELITCLITYFSKAKKMSFQWKKRLVRIFLKKTDWKRFRFTGAQLCEAFGPLFVREAYREPIGRWFSIDSEDTFEEAPRVQNTETHTYYASGREPELAVAERISGGNKTVLVPYFTCNTVFQPFLEKGWKLVHYKVNRELHLDTADVEALYEAHRPSLAIFMEYSGMDLTAEELRTIGKLKQRGCVTMVDRTQNIYSTARAKEIDFYYGSLRKWYCFPDGAYLEKNGDIPLPPAPPEGEYNDVYATLRGMTMFANGQVRENKIMQYGILSDACSKLAAMYVCTQPVRLRNMSEYSKAVYLREQAHDREYARQRMENFQYIFHRISSFTHVRPVCPDRDRFTSAPMCFHVYAQDRAKLARYLSAHNIETQLLWTKSRIFDVPDEQTEYIFQHILSLPCDQRYSREDMETLCNVLESYEKGKNA